MKAEDSAGGSFFQPRRYNIGNPIKLVQLVDKAMMNLVVVGEDIAEENPDYKVCSPAPPPFLYTYIFFLEK